MTTRTERLFETARISRHREFLKAREENYRLKGHYAYALEVNDALFYWSMQLLARTESSFERSFLHDTIQRSFYYQAQLQNNRRNKHE